MMRKDLIYTAIMGAFLLGITAGSVIMGAAWTAVVIESGYGEVVNNKIEWVDCENY